MKSFYDNKQVLYHLELTAGKGRKLLLARFDVDLLEPDRDSGKLFEIVRSTVKMMDLIWALVSSQCDQSVTTEDDFWDRFTPELLAKAIQAMREEIDFFIQTVQPQADVRLKLQKAAKVEELSRQKVAEYLESQELDGMLSGEIDAVLGNVTAQLRDRFRSHSSSLSSPALLGPTLTE